MKFAGVVLLLFISLSSFSHSRDSIKTVEKQRVRIERKNLRIEEREFAKAEKEKAKIERKRERIMTQWDQRSVQQKRTDRQALLFLALCAGALVHVMSTHGE